MSRGRRDTLTLIACISMAACASDKDEGATSSIHVDPPYFGQPVPGLVPEPFAPGIVSTDAIEFDSTPKE